MLGRRRALSLVAGAASLGCLNNAKAVEKLLPHSFAPPILPAGKKNLPPKHRPIKTVVALDAGHGGKDPGAIGARGVYEKNITLAMVQHVAKQLDATGRYQIVLTRQDDRFIALNDRVRIARAARAQLFVSLHADSVANPLTEGFSVYTLSSEASDHFAATLANRENAADLIGGIDMRRHPREVSRILFDLLNRETQNNSLVMASTAVETLHPPFQPLERPHRSANFAVLRAPDIPSILVEMGFLSNARDAIALQKPSHQKELANRLAASIEHYFHTVTV